ncbi:cardiolipin synthase [Alkalibacillus flavidus]|uniref:Cardiolipin synthase n=1 Tax=Alkalibacillus flavidus TaxID=546021 RepID=A0ABV2KZR5_9BACI
MWALIIIAIMILIAIVRPDQKPYHQPSPYPPTDANVTFFSNGHDLFRHYIETLQSANKWILVQFFIIKDDTFSDEVLSVLRDKATSGVSVYLLVDFIGARAISKSNLEALDHAGFHVIFSNRFRLRRPFSSLNRRNHRKISVIDGDTGFLGGFNIGDQYVNQGGKFANWRDYHLQLTGSIVDHLTTQFCSDWFDNTGESLSFSKLNKRRGLSQVQLIPSANGLLEDTFIRWIQQAEHTIQIGTPYFIPSKRLMNVLVDKMQSGVHVTILYPHDSDHPLVKEASAPYLKQIATYGGSVYLFYNGFYHAKLFMMDDQFIDIGTANFDRRSLFVNDEVKLVTKDLRVVNQIKHEFQRDVDASINLYDDWFKTPNAFMFRLKQLIARLLRPFL